MPELIFGAKKKTDKTAFENFQPGFYRKARYYATGPLSITRGLSNYTNYVPKSVDNPLLNKDYAVLGHTNGLETVTQEYGDSYKINAAEAYKDYAMYILFLAGLVYALVNLIISGVADLIRLVRKVPTKAPVDLKIWNYLTSLVILAVAFNFYLIFIALATSQTAIVQPWRYMVFAGIGMILAVSAVYPLVSKAKERLGKGSLFLTGLTSLAALAIVANILYWSLYQWWVL